MILRLRRYSFFDKIYCPTQIFAFRRHMLFTLRRRQIFSFITFAAFFA